MGLMDREYTRRTHRTITHSNNWRTWILTAGSVLAVASAAVWLLRDVRSLIPESTPREGSLVVNINTASAVELETIPGVGPALAALIIAGRPYETVDDLVRVSGIGDRTLEGMRPFVTADGQTRRR